MNSDLNELAEKHNSRRSRWQGRIVMPNERLVALWLHEIIGQLSDGAWENHWHDHVDSWEDYTNLRISLNPNAESVVIKQSTIDGELPDFLARDIAHDNDLVDIIGERMVDAVKQYGHEEYDEEDVRRDLLMLNDATIE